MATGKPCSSPKSITCWASEMNVLSPGTPSTPTFSAAWRAEILSPITSMASGPGPMNFTPRSVIALQKSLFSEKNP